MLRRLASSSRRMGGMTLIELLIVVLIGAILTGLAVSNYENSVRASKRAEAKAVLIQLAHRLEVHYSENYNYSGLAIPAGVPVGALSEPGEVHLGIQNLQYYGLALTVPAAPNDDTFLLVATPINSMLKDDCGILSIDHTGLRDVQSSSYLTAESEATYPADVCWSQ